MEAEPQRLRLRGRHDALPLLEAAIDALVLARDTTKVTPAKDAFDFARILLDTIKSSVINQPDYVELGLACASFCQVLDRGVNGRRMDQLDRAVMREIEKFATITKDIQEHVIKLGNRGVLSRHFHPNGDKKAIAAWRLDLGKIRRFLDIELVAETDVDVCDVRHGISITEIPQVRPDVPNTHAAVSRISHDIVHPRPIVSQAWGDILTTPNTYCDILGNREEADRQNREAYASAPNESPPPLPVNTPGTNSDIRRDLAATRAIMSRVQRDVTEIQHTLKSRDYSGSQNWTPQSRILGEPPPPPRTQYFGRDDLTETIVTLTEDFRSVALVGVGGIGKTSIALSVLHHSRIKERFGENRRFIRCDQFAASQANFLNRLSETIGAGIENPENLTPLRRYLSSKEILIVLDNAESILDPQGTDGQGIYRAVEELSQFPNICLVITSRITLVPSNCETVDVPTLSMEAARDAFHCICKHGGRSDSIDNILRQLDFHPLSVTLLATVAHQNKWDGGRLAREWEQHHTGVLRTDHGESLGATIELSLASSMFENLGPHARDLLGVIAFFPQGVNEANLDWLFPTIPNVVTIFDKFCVLSLTHRSNGFITMLVPLRDYLRPKDPLLSPLLCASKEAYFTRLSAKPDPLAPGSKETQWIALEDANVEHLLDVLTSIHTNSDDVWSACASFMELLYRHKPRETVLGPKIEHLPDDHPLKPSCLLQLAWLFHAAGNGAEEKRLLNCILELERERGNEDRAAFALVELSDANRMLGFHKEGIHQAEEALKFYERSEDTAKQGYCLMKLAWLFCDDNQLDAAQEAASRAIQLLSQEGQEFLLCRSHRVLGKIYCSKGEREKAIRHFKTALGIASRFDWSDQLFWVHYSMALLFLDEDKPDDANAHVEQAKLHTVDNPYSLGRVTELQAEVFHRQSRFGDATSEARRAVEIYEKLGAIGNLENCGALLRRIERAAKSPASRPSTPSSTAADIS